MMVMLGCNRFRHIRGSEDKSKPKSWENMLINQLALIMEN